jgi:hypothetical protein
VTYALALICLHALPNGMGSCAQIFLRRAAMSEHEEYHQNLMADIRREADASGVLMVEAFFDRMTERLTEAGELEVADRAFYQSGEGGQRLRIDGYAGDPRDSEGILGLIVCDFVDSAMKSRPLERPIFPPILNPLIRFLKKARTEEFRDSLNEVSPAFQVSDLIIATWSQRHQGQADPGFEPALHRPGGCGEAGRCRRCPGHLFSVGSCPLRTLRSLGTGARGHGHRLRKGFRRAAACLEGFSGRRCP